MPQNLMPSCSLTRLVNRVLAGAADIHQGEGRAVLTSGMLFFLILMAVTILRPLRDAVGLKSGIETLRVLIIFSIPLLLLAMPAFGYLISRVSRPVLLTISFRFCALVLLGFYVVLAWLPGYAGQESALVRSSGWLYVIFHALFNLLLVSLFWALMADLFDIAESKRLFPAIAIGGTLGAIAGSACAGCAAHWLGHYTLLLIAAALLEAAGWTTRIVTWNRIPRSLQPTAPEPIGGHWLAGITGLGRSPYLLGISLFVLLTSMTYTMFHFTQLRIVAEAAETMQQRTVLFAHIDVWAQLATLLAQALLASRVIRLLGVGTTLAVLPLLAITGFTSLATMPTLAVCIPFGATYPGRLEWFHQPRAGNVVHRRRPRAKIQGQVVPRHVHVPRRRCQRRIGRGLDVRPGARHCGPGRCGATAGIGLGGFGGRPRQDAGKTGDRRCDE